MELDVVMPQKLRVKSVEVQVKVVDQGNYTLKDENGQEVAEISEDSVPGFFPGEHFGDYLILDIELETGKVLNWRAPSPQEVAKAFDLVKGERE